MDFIIKRTLLIYSTVYVEHNVAEKSAYSLYACAAVEHLLARERLQWHGSVLSFAPKPHLRHSRASPVSSTQTDDSGNNMSVRVGEEMRSDECGKHTDDDHEKFYDTVTDQLWLLPFKKERRSTDVNIAVPPQHTGDSSGALAETETSDNDVGSVSTWEEEIVCEEPSPLASSQASTTKADVISDVEALLTDAKNLQQVAVITREISTLSSQKLKLLKKLVKKKKICKQCVVKVDLEYEAVTLKGTEEDILTTELAIYETLASVGERSLNISEALGHLIASPIGQQWFDESCNNCSVVGICYVDNSGTKLLAADDIAADAIHKWLTDALRSERKSFNHHHLPFLQTHEWKEFVRKSTDSQLLVIAEDSSKMEILVEGQTDKVKTAVKEIDDLLNRMCHINKKLTLKPADFRTLSFRCTDIVNEVQELR